MLWFCFPIFILFSYSTTHFVISFDLLKSLLSNLIFSYILIIVYGENSIIIFGIHPAMNSHDNPLHLTCFTAFIISSSSIDSIIISLSIYISLFSLSFFIPSLIEYSSLHSFYTSFFASFPKLTFPSFDLYT